MNLKNALWSAILLAGTAINGCTTNSIDPVEQNKDIIASAQTDSKNIVNGFDDMQSLNFDNVATFLTQEGYDTTTLTEYDDYYLIDNELLFMKSFVAEQMQKPMTRITVEPQVLSKEFYRIHLNVQCNIGLETIITEAVNAWNNLGNCAINFTTNLNDGTNITSRYMVYMTILNDPFGTDMYPNLITVSAPLSGQIQPGANLIINTSVAPWSQLDSSQKKYAIMHALGHLVRLKHPEQNNNYNQTMYDENSIMKSENGLVDNLNLWQGFTMWDIEALRHIYPRNEEQWSYYTTPVPAIGNKMDINTEYTITPGCNYAWLCAPTYTIEYECSGGAVILKNTNDDFKFRFTSPGNCKVTITAHDSLGEKKADGSDFLYEETYSCQISTPTFTYPDRTTSMVIGTFYDFGISIDETACHDVSYNFSVQESVFDNNTGENAIIEPNGAGQVRIKFLDYGKYTVTATVNYTPNNYTPQAKTYRYQFAYYYRPYYNLIENIIEGGSPIVLPDYSDTPTGPNQGPLYHIGIKIGNEDVIDNRIVCQVYEKMNIITMWNPNRPDLRVEYGYNYERIMHAGDSATFFTTPRNSMLHPDSINYQDHYTIMYPLASLFYPSNTKGLLLGNE